MKSLYKPKYARQLREGLRKDGKIIEECCAIWGVSVDAYRDWRKAHPKFEEAHQIGDRDYKCWWMNEYRDIATGKKAGNAAMMNLTAKNVLGYVDKQEVHNTHEEKITTLRIEVHKPIENIGRTIDVESGHMLDAEPVKLLQPPGQTED